MKEIGGYFELDCSTNGFLHPDGVRLNSGRNALRYIVRACRIQTLFVPYFTCPVVWQALRDEGCELTFYEVGLDLLPTQSFPKDAFILYTNYFGINGRNVQKLAGEYPHLIVDNAQALYAFPCGFASFYSPRKFFGLPDGGIAYCSQAMDLPTERDSSVHRMMHLLKRIDTGSASAGYADFKASDESLDTAPVLRMSRLTEALMGNLRVEDARIQRLKNMRVLHAELHSPLLDRMDDADVPLVYPYYTEKATSLRRALIAQNIYVATYWPGVDRNRELSDTILALPIDQRYSVEDMQFIVQVLRDIR